MGVMFTLVTAASCGLFLRQWIKALFHLEFRGQKSETLQDERVWVAFGYKAIKIIYSDLIDSHVSRVRCGFFPSTNIITRSCTWILSRKGANTFLSIHKTFAHSSNRFCSNWCLMIEERCVALVQEFFQTGRWSLVTLCFQKPKRQTWQLWKIWRQLDRFHNLWCPSIPKSCMSQDKT